MKNMLRISRIGFLCLTIVVFGARSFAKTSTAAIAGAAVGGAAVGIGGTLAVQSLSSGKAIGVHSSSSDETATDGASPTADSSSSAAPVTPAASSVPIGGTIDSTAMNSSIQSGNTTLTTAPDGTGNNIYTTTNPNGGTTILTVDPATNQVVNSVTTQSPDAAVSAANSNSSTHPAATAASTPPPAGASGSNSGATTSANPSSTASPGSVTSPAGACSPDNPTACTSGVCGAVPPAMTQIDLPGVQVAKDISAVQSAQKWCLSDCSPTIATAVPILQTAVGAISGLASSSALCGKLGEILIGVQATMTAFDLACTTARINCNSQLNADIGIVSTAIKNYPNNPQVGQWKILLGQLKQADNTCSSFLATSLGALSGIISIAESASKSNSCKKDLSGSSSTNTNASGVDCSVAANASTQACICLASPNATGCTNGVPTGDNATGIIASNAGSNNTTTTTNTGTATTSNGTTTTVGSGTITPVTTNTGTAVNATNGAGANGSLTGALDATKSVAKDQKTGSAGAVDATAAAAYAPYLPGGSEYNRNIASVNSAKTGITGAGGSDNFAKASAAYLKVAPSLDGK